MKLTQLEHIHKLAEELKSHDKIVEELKKEDVAIRIGGEYNAPAIQGPSEFIDDVRRCLIEWVSERRGAVKNKLKAEGVEIDD